MEFALVGVGASAGAALRFAVAEAAARRAAAGQQQAMVMWAVAGVNVAGSFALGCLAGSGAPRRQALVLGTGACGGFTTYSTFALDASRLIREGSSGTAALFITTTCAGSIVAAAAGWLLARRTLAHSAKR